MALADIASQTLQQASIRGFGGRVWHSLARFFRDARHGQILVLTTLLIVGIFTFGFDIRLWNVVAIFSATLLTQIVFQKFVFNASQLDLRSPLITGLSLSLLLRVDGATLMAAWPAFAAGIIAISAKFLLRVQGKHIFNPANIGIVVMLLCGQAWTTPGQWGPLLLGAFALAGAGFFVTYKAARIDIPVMFLGTYAALIFGRALWLGDPLTIPLLNLQSGALLLFAFFMISDPKTSPDTMLGRFIFAAGTALLAWYLQYFHFISDGIFYALAFTCLFRPLIDFALPGARHQWSSHVSLKGKNS